MSAKGGGRYWSACGRRRSGSSVCPACLNSYITTATVITGSAGGLVAVVRKVLIHTKGESRWRIIKSYLTPNGLRPGKNT